MELNRFNIISRIIIIFAIIIFVAIITVGAIMEVDNRHYNRLYRVMYSNIEEKAYDCYLKNECSTKILLSELIEKEYLNAQVNPKTNEYINPLSYVEITDNIAKFTLVK